MDKLDQYQLFLFDFDGLLVNTEELHYAAYKRMMENRNVPLTWDFMRYCKNAHYDSHSFRIEIAKEFPKLMEGNDLDPQDPWKILYHEKQTLMQEFLRLGAVHLMPGVEAFLKVLQERNIPHSVVTHSPDEIVRIVRTQHPILDRIPYWVTRHDYTHPKPDPECYQLAVARYSKPGDRVIGFEDTPRGLRALLGTSVIPYLITQVEYPEIPEFKERGVKVLPSFDGILEEL